MMFGFVGKNCSQLNCGSSAAEVPNKLIFSKKSLRFILNPSVLLFLIRYQKMLLKIQLFWFDTMERFTENFHDFHVLFGKHDGITDNSII